MPERRDGGRPLPSAASSFAAFLMTSTVMLVVAMLVVHGELTIELLRDQNPLHAVSRSRIGLLVLVMLPAVGHGMPSICAAVAFAGANAAAVGVGAWTLADLGLGRRRRGDAIGRHGVGRRDRGYLWKRANR